MAVRADAITYEEESDDERGGPGRRGARPAAELVFVFPLFFAFLLLFFFDTGLMPDGRMIGGRSPRPLRGLRQGEIQWGPQLRGIPVPTLGWILGV